MAALFAGVVFCVVSGVEAGALLRGVLAGVAGAAAADLAAGAVEAGGVALDADAGTPGDFAAAASAVFFLWVVVPDWP